MNSRDGNQPTKMKALPDPDEAASAPPAISSSGRGRGRGVLVWVLVVLAALIGFVSTLTTWVNRQALDTKSWTNASAKLLDDPAVRSALSAYIVNQLYDHVDVSSVFAQKLPPNLKGFAGPLAAGLRSPAQDQVDRLLGRPRTLALWVNANRVAHERLVAIVEDKNANGVSTANGTVTVDLRTIVIDLAQQLGLPGTLVSKIPEGAGQITVLKSDQLSLAQTAVKSIRLLSIWLVVLVLLLWALALYLARGARRATLRDIGWSIVVVGLLLLVVRRVGGDYVLGALTTSQTRPAGTAAWLIGTEILGQIGWALVAYGVVAVLGALLAGPTRLATRIRGWLAPTLNTRQAIVWLTVGLAYLLLVLWGPTHSLRTPFGILLLGALVGLGVYALRRETLLEFPDAVHGNGHGMAAHVEGLWSRRRQRSAHAHAKTSNGSAGSVAAEIERLHALRSSRVITEEEFQRGKDRALA
jgi:hypothetical protein